MSKPTSPKPLVTTPAPLTKKLGAWLYDALICIAIWFLWGLFTFPLIRWLLGVDDIYTAQDTLIYKIYSVLPALLILFYFVGSHVRFGQTVGMSSWKLMLVQNNGKPVTLGQALVRDITAVLGIGMLFSLFNSKKLGWHDMISGTRVVALPDKKDD